MSEGGGVASGPATGVKPGALTALLKEVAAFPERRDEDALPLPPGTVIGRFEIVRELGRGGFGVVYEAKDRDLGRPVAVKVVRPGRMREEEGIVTREAEAIARLSHPNLVTLYDVGRSGGTPYLVFELLRGKTLDLKIEEGPLSIHEAVHVATEVARGLAHAHGEGVVHRDLKPANVFVTNKGQVKILDFGMAHAFGRRRLSGGTPAYMAPEQWDDDPEDERTDVFALGVMLYRMLTGEHPFPEGKGRWAAEPASVGRVDAPGAPDLAELVERMLARTPRDRPRDGAAVLAALAPIEERLRARPADGRPPEHGRRRKATPGDLLAELKRRHVFRVTLGYGVFAFAVLQVAEPILHGAQLPNWVLSVVLVALACGFPVAVILAWIYDLTGKGVVRTPAGIGSPGRAVASPRLAPVLVATIVVAATSVAGYLALREGGWLRKPGALPDPRPTTAAPDKAAVPASRPEFVILAAPFKASEASAEADAKLMDGLVVRALEKFVRGAPTVAVVVGTSSPNTEVEAKALGRAAGARLVLWGNLTALRDELVLNPVWTPTNSWGRPSVEALTAGPYRWKRDESKALGQRRQDAEKIGAPAARAAASFIGDKAAGLGILDNIGERTEASEMVRQYLLRAMYKGEEAVPVLREALARWPRSFRLHLALYTTLRDIGQADLARAELVKLGRLATKGNELLGVAAALDRAGDRKGAEEFALRALRGQPGDKSLSIGFARMLIGWGRRDEARLLLVAGAREPLSAHEADMAGRALDALGQREASQRLRRRAIVDEDLSPFQRIRHAEALSHSAAASDRELAAEGARRCAAEAPDMPWVQISAGEVLLRTGLEDGGIALLRGALVLDPDNPEAQAALGKALLHREPNRARDLLRRSVRPDYKDSSEWANVVKALLSARASDDAQRAIEGTAGAEPKPPLLDLRCDAQALSGQRSGALATAEALRSDDALAERAPLSAFVCMVKAGDRDAARAALAAARPLVKDPWLARIASHLLGEGSESDLFRLDGSLSDWDAATRLCEANYYAGLSRLRPVSGTPDPAAATGRLRASIEWGMHCSESTLAEIELYRLEHPVP